MLFLVWNVGFTFSLGANVFLHNYTLISLNISLKMDVNSKVQTWEGQSKYSRQNSNNMKQSIEERTGMVAFLVIHMRLVSLDYKLSKRKSNSKFNNPRASSDWKKIFCVNMGWLPSVALLVVPATDTQSSKGMLEIIIITYDVLRVEYLISVYIKVTLHYIAMIFVNCKWL